MRRNSPSMTTRSPSQTSGHETIMSWTELGGQGTVVSVVEVMSVLLAMRPRVVRQFHLEAPRHVPARLPGQGTAARALAQKGNCWIAERVGCYLAAGLEGGHDGSSRILSYSTFSRAASDSRSPRAANAASRASFLASVRSLPVRSDADSALWLASSVSAA